MIRLASLLLLAALTACTASAALPCGDGFCPTGTTCVASDAGLDCVVREGECGAFADGTRCEGGGQHLCVDGQCVVSGCGDDYVDPTIGEECDLGADNSPLPNRVCRTITCHYASCGDGVTDTNPPDQPPLPPRADEQCDDGAQNSDVTADACRSGCARAACGDGVIDSGELPSCFAAAVMAGSAALSPDHPLVADLDDDGLDDLITIADPDAPPELVIYYGRLDGGFDRAVVTLDETGGPVALGDLDADRDLDLLVVGDTTLMLVRASGPRQLDAPEALPLPTGFAVALVDLDGDLDDDLLLAAGDVFVYRNDPGGFVQTQTIAVTTNIRHMFAADVSGDGRADVLVENKANILVLVNDGAGGVTQAPALTPSGTFALEATADVDGDGVTDVVTLGLDAGELSIWRALGAGAFAAPASIAGEFGTVCAGDLDGDGHVDLVSMGASDTVSVLRGVGGGQFQLELPRAVGAPVFDASVLVDADHDGYLDLVLASGDTLYRAAGGDGAFGPRITVAAAASTDFVAGDLDGDGVAEIVLLDDLGLTLIPGRATLRFDPADRQPLLPGDAVVEAWIGPLGAPAQRTLVGWTGDQMIVLAPDAQGELVERQRVSDVALPAKLYQLDITGDGLADVIGFEDNSPGIDLHVWPALADGTLGVRLDASFSAGDRDRMAFADVDGDGALDLLSVQAGQLTWYRGGGDGTFDSGPRAPLESDVISVAATDLDGDGHDDVIVARAAGGLDVLLGDGAGGYTPGFSVAGIDGSDELFLGDLDGDGRVDLLVDGDALRVFRNPGDGTLVGPFGQVSDTTRQLADVTGDGRADLLGGNFKQPGVSIRVSRLPRAP